MIIQLKLYRIMHNIEQHVYNGMHMHRCMHVHVLSWSEQSGTLAGD